MVTVIFCVYCLLCRRTRVDKACLCFTVIFHVCCLLCRRTGVDKACLCLQ